MTICVAVHVAEGLVLGADSTVALMGQIAPNAQGQIQQVMIQSFNHANKVTHFKDYPIGVLTWGLGSIEARSIQSLIGEFEHSYPAIKEKIGSKTKGAYTVKEVGDSLVAFIKQRYDAAFPPPAAAAPGAAAPPKGMRPALGLLVGGFSHMEFFANSYAYTFPDAITAQEVRPFLNGKPQFGVNWYGMTDALVRLIKGYDPSALAELVKRGVDQAVLQKWLADGVGELPLVFDGMPLQDAVDFADYAVRVVIGRYRFATGAQLCGGDVDIAVITPDKFDWAQRKRWGVHHE